MNTTQRRAKIQQALYDYRSAPMSGLLEYEIYQTSRFSIDGLLYTFKLHHCPDSIMNFLRVFLEFSPKTKTLVELNMSEAEVRCVEMGIPLTDGISVSEVEDNLAGDDKFSLDEIVERSRFRILNGYQPPHTGNENLIHSLKEQGYYYLAERIENNLRNSVRKLGNAYSN